MIKNKYSSFVILQVLKYGSTPITVLNEVISKLFTKDNFIIIAKNKHGNNIIDKVSTNIINLYKIHSA